MYDYTLVMTACIAPKPASPVKRKNPEIRLKDYENALRFWLTYPDRRIQAIVFIDNSGYDLHSLKKLSLSNPLDRKIEFMQIPEVELPVSPQGKTLYAYGEADILNQAFLSSQLVQNSRYIIKTTGRLFFPNLSELLSAIPQNVDFVIDCRKIPVAYAVTTLFLSKYDFYMKHLFALKEQIKLSYKEIEFVYYEYLLSLHNANMMNLCLRFPINVPPVGFGAHSDKNYNQGFWDLRNVPVDFSEDMHLLFGSEGRIQNYKNEKKS